jgi:hypothetical protein
MITFEDARRVALDCVRHDVSVNQYDESIPLLESAYAEADYCWIFFRNRLFVMPPERAMSDSSNCISKKGTVRSIPNYLEDPVRLAEYLVIMSNHFRERGL